jgi:predicted DNA repair protein MutK
MYVVTAMARFASTRAVGYVSADTASNSDREAFFELRRLS